MMCNQCCAWNAPLNVPPIGNLDGKRVHLPGAQVLMTYEQHLFWHYHVLIHQGIEALVSP